MPSGLYWNKIKVNIMEKSEPESKRPETNLMEKGVAIITNFEENLGGVIRIMVFPSAAITTTRHVNPAIFEGLVYLSFTTKKALKDLKTRSKKPSDSSNFAQYMPFGFEALDQHKIAGGRLLITKKLGIDSEVMIGNAGQGVLASIFPGSGDDLRRTIKKELLETMLPAIGIEYTDDKWEAVKIIMDALELAIAKLDDLKPFETGLYSQEAACAICPSGYSCASKPNVKEDTGSLNEQLTPAAKEGLGALFGNDKPVIEIYYDHEAVKDAHVGCFRARLQSDHTKKSTGVSISDAIYDLMLTLKRFNIPHDEDDYVTLVVDKAEVDAARVDPLYVPLKEKLAEYVNRIGIHSDLNGTSVGSKVDLVDFPVVKVTTRDPETLEWTERIYELTLTLKSTKKIPAKKEV